MEMKSHDRGLDLARDSQYPKGKNYLLAIAINEYKYCSKLNNAVRDVETFIEVMKSIYHFDQRCITFIKDEQATEKGIEKAFDRLIDLVTAQDNLIVYFSGHGRYDKQRGGYWIPVEAGTTDEDWADYISNDTIKSYLSKINSFHTFLIADSCFSGSLFIDKSREKFSGDRRDTEPSRWGLTSGKKEIVSDGQEGNHSPFAAALLDVLRKAKEPLGAMRICDQVIEKVVANAQQTPMGSPMQVSGHQGGQMVFYPNGFKPYQKTLDIPKPKIKPPNYAKFNWINLALAVLGIGLLVGLPYLLPNPSGRKKGQELIELFEMKYVQGDTFQMGNPSYESDRPVHTVKLSSFYMGETEVTKKQWLEVMEILPMGVDPNSPDDYPIVAVNWNDVQKFIKKLNQKSDTIYRLPTEAEWEFAAKGGIHKSTYKYSGGNDLNKVAWHHENSANRHPVGENGHANALGIFDMSGNVWEWCSDYYAKYPDTLTINPTGPLRGKYRVMRGGAWGSKKSYSFQCTSRGSRPPNFKGNDTGFRLVIPIEDK